VKNTRIIQIQNSKCEKFIMCHKNSEATEALILEFIANGKKKKECVREDFFVPDYIFFYLLDKTDKCVLRGHRGPAGKGMVLFRIATGILGSNLSRPTNFSTVIGDAISL
jgi:hypothetical protein